MKKSKERVSRKNPQRRFSIESRGVGEVPEQVESGIDRDDPTESDSIKPNQAKTTIPRCHFNQTLPSVGQAGRPANSGPVKPNQAQSR